MENIKLKTLHGNLGDTVFKYNILYKLSDDSFLIRGQNCIKLCELKNSKFECISLYQGFPWTILGILELKDKNIIVSGRKFINIFKLNNKNFELIQEFIGSQCEFAELIDIFQLENEKILINSVLGIILVLEKKEGKYKIIKEIKIERHHSIETIGNNKILLIESIVDYSECKFTNDPKITKSIISIMDFNEENVKKKIIHSKFKIYLSFFSSKTIFKLKNGLFIFVSDTLYCPHNIFIFNLNMKK